MKKFLGSSPSEPTSTVSPDGDAQAQPAEDDSIREYLREYTRSVLVDEATAQLAMHLTDVKAADVSRARTRAGALHDYWDQLADAVSSEGLLLHQQRQVDYLQRRVEQLGQLEQLRQREAELRAVLFPSEPIPAVALQHGVPEEEG